MPSTPTSTTLSLLLASGLFAVLGFVVGTLLEARNEGWCRALLIERYEQKERHAEEAKRHHEQAHGGLPRRPHAHDDRQMRRIDLHGDGAGAALVPLLVTKPEGARQSDGAGNGSGRQRASEHRGDSHRAHGRTETNHEAHRIHRVSRAGVD